MALIWLCAPIIAGPDSDMAQAKDYLKDYLKQVNQKYPYSEWEKQLDRSRATLNRVQTQASASSEKFNRNVYEALEGMKGQVEQIAKYRTSVNLLIRQLYASTLVAQVDGRFIQAGKTWDPEGRLAFHRTLMQYEAGSLKPKSNFLANSAAFDRDFRTLQTDILYVFATDYLGSRVEHHLQAFNLAKIEAIYDDYSLQLEYWSKSSQTNASQTQDQLSQLSQKFEEKKTWLKQNLEGLMEALKADMLFSDLLEYASQQHVEFSLEVEEKIEASLKQQSQVTLAPIQNRIQLWKEFANNLKDKATIAQELANDQRREAIARADDERSQAMARADDERNEQARLDALRAEQQRLEDEQKAKFKETLTALRTFTFKTETSVELDDDAQKALSTKAGFLKTSFVRSGSKKLKVEKEKFSDTLAMVQKFNVEEGQVDFSKMSLQERSNQSAYTYRSPNGRTSQGDLANFVAEVALGSFSSFYTFLSYVTPSHWNVGRAFNWMADRRGEKVAQDREFSYVDLVVDAHRKRSGGQTREESTSNLPANMVVFFDPQGGIKRFQSFADIGQVIIQSGDLVGGKIYYKFLNYSTDQQHIYLNGIDGEMKVGVPGGKS